MSNGTYTNNNICIDQMGTVPCRREAASWSNTREVLIAAMVKTFEAVTTWRKRSVQRRQLQTLDARMLSDIGINRADVDNEAQKPFWVK